MFPSFANFQPFTQQQPGQNVATVNNSPALTSLATQSPSVAPINTTSSTDQQAYNSVQNALKQQLIGSITGNSSSGQQSALMQGLQQYANGLDNSMAGSVVNGMAGNTGATGYGSQLMQGMGGSSTAGGAAGSAADGASQSGGWLDSILSMFS